MNAGDPTDPLLRQVLPIDRELDEVPNFVSDPLGEHAALRAPGLLQKYRGRGHGDDHDLGLRSSLPLLFPARIPYLEQEESPRWQAALAEIGRDNSLEEVILSGGDPLSLSDARLKV